MKENLTEFNLFSYCTLTNIICLHIVLVWSLIVAFLQFGGSSHPRGYHHHHSEHALNSIMEGFSHPRISSMSSVVAPTSIFDEREYHVPKTQHLLYEACATKNNEYQRQYF